MNAARRTRQAGLTLLEMLVGLVIISMLAMLAFQTLRSSQLMLNQAARRQSDSDERAAVAFIRDQIESAAPVVARVDAGRAIVAFTGDDDSIEFVSAAPLAAEEPQFQRMRLFLEDSALVMERAPLQSAGEPRRRLLLNRVAALTIEYGYVNGDSLLQFDRAWRDRSEAPKIIRFTYNHIGRDDAIVFLASPKISAVF